MTAVSPAVSTLRSTQQAEDMNGIAHDQARSVGGRATGWLEPSRSLEDDYRMGNGIRISQLSGDPDIATVLAEWFETEWHDYFGSKPPGHALAMISDRANRLRLPLCLVAFKGVEPVGTASLAASSIDECADVGPWIVGHLVHPMHRHRGVGMALIDEGVRVAASLGHSSLYIAIRRGHERFEARGWAIHAWVDHEAQSLCVLRRALES